MVITFTLTSRSHYNSITEPCTLLLSLMKDLSIDIPSHFITSIIDVYQDIATHDKLIFPSAITQILWHFSFPIPLPLLFTIMGTISVGFVRWSEAQLRLKRPQVETDDPAAFAVPPSSSTPSTSALSSSTAGVTLDVIMAQVQRMDARLDYLTDEMCQMNTRVGHIARRQARMVGFTPSPFPSLEALVDEDDDAGADKDDAGSFISFFKKQFSIFENKKLVWQLKMNKKQNMFSKLNL